jgi:hypothetical protein
VNHEQLDALMLARLRALVGGVVATTAGGEQQVEAAAEWEGRSWEPVDFGPGVALISPARQPADATEAVVYPREQTIRSLGEALVWERSQHRVTDLNLVLDGAVDDALAWHIERRASAFVSPLVTVWVCSEGEGGVRMHPLDSTGVDPLDGLAGTTKPWSSPELVDVLLDAGVEVVAEGGIVRGEVNGLEVARITHGTSSWGTPLDGPALEVGVGLADREMTGVVHAGLEPSDRLVRAAEFVHAHRTASAQSHPLNRLVPERWLRALLIRQPERLGLAELRAAEGWPARTNLVDRGVAVAEGRTDDDRPVVVAISVGVDVDLVPTAADARLMVDPDAQLWVVVPDQDCHPVTVALVGGLMEPARLVTVPDDWRSW